MSSQTINLKTESDFWSANQEREDQAPLTAPQVELELGLILHEQSTNYLQQYLAIYFPVSKNSHWTHSRLVHHLYWVGLNKEWTTVGLACFFSKNKLISWCSRANPSHFGLTRASIHLYKEIYKQLRNHKVYLLYHIKEDLKILNFGCTRFFMKIKNSMLIPA